MGVSSAARQATAPSPPYRVGDFGTWHFDDRVYRLDLCPLCELDPERDRHIFDPDTNGSGRAEHFSVEHGPEDAGRPLADLLGD